MITKAQLIQIHNLWNTIAGENLTVFTIDREVVAYGTELACLRLFNYFITNTIASIDISDLVKDMVRNGEVNILRNQYYYTGGVVIQTKNNENRWMFFLPSDKATWYLDNSI